jgi:hypothetical protein
MSLLSLNDGPRFAQWSDGVSRDWHGLPRRCASGARAEGPGGTRPSSSPCRIERSCDWMSPLGPACHLPVETGPLSARSARPWVQPRRWKRFFESWPHMQRERHGRRFGEKVAAGCASSAMPSWSHSRRSPGSSRARTIRFRMKIGGHAFRKWRHRGSPRAADPATDSGSISTSPRPPGGPGWRRTAVSRCTPGSAPGSR